jgi:hypothetical protein
VQIVLYVFTGYVGVVLAVTLFGSDKRSRRAERALRELLGVFKKTGSNN